MYGYIGRRANDLRLASPFVLALQRGGWGAAVATPPAPEPASAEANEEGEDNNYGSHMNI